MRHGLSAVGRPVPVVRSVEHDGRRRRGARDPDIASLISATSNSTAMPIAEVDTLVGGPRSTGIGELDRVLGDGIVPGSVILLGGEPGIGKSTLLLQLLARGRPHAVRQRRGKCAAGSVARRTAGRRRCPTCGCSPRHHFPTSSPPSTTVQPNSWSSTASSPWPTPSLSSAPGSVVQVRGCAHRLVHEAKSRGMPVVLVGHVTKDGGLAGPRMLEHVVDAVLGFEGDRHHSLRLLRAVKNRFGPTDELGVFEMVEHGLVGVPDASRLFLTDRRTGVAGSAVAAHARGSAPVAGRGPGAHQPGQLRRAASAQRAGPRPRPAGAAAGRARAPARMPMSSTEVLRIGCRWRPAGRAGRRPGHLPGRRQRHWSIVRLPPISWLVRRGRPGRRGSPGGPGPRAGSPRRRGSGSRGPSCPPTRPTVSTA